jgi:RHS repeat-associated protein
VLPNDTRIDYVLDAMNRRIGVKRNGVLVKGYLYNEGPKPIAELDAASTVVARFVYGVRGAVPEYLIKAGQTYRIISDHLGSVRLVVDANGSTVQRIDYDEYGQITQNTNPGFQPFGFAGGLVDDGTRLVQFGARNYDPYVGRWISQDPIRFAGMSANLYSYAGGDPINVSDPTGMCAEDCKTNPALVPLDTKALKVQFSSDAMNLFSPEMASILTQQISALNKQSITPVITDGYRTEATQWSRRQNNSAAAQGTSLHQTGNAVDFGPNSNGSNFDDISDAMDKSGLRIGRKFETPDPVHWDRNPYSTQDERDSAAQRAEDFFWNCVLGLGTKPTIK